jgi:aryl-alcohol dehydrogenase-like predicted oxidoreductase
MERTLNRSEVRVTPVIFGAWAIGGWLWGGNDEKDSIAAIQASLDHGITTIDTAAVYGMGRSEELIGKAIKGRKDKVVIATKGGLRWDTEEGSNPWASVDFNGNPVTMRNNSKHLVKECDESLKRLGVEAIDLYQIHWPDTTTPIEESWNTMVELKKAGKVKAIGVSNYNLDQLKRCQAIHQVASLQPPYSLLRRDIEKDLVPFCIKNNISIIVYSPLERGLLTGKVSPDRKFEKGDHRTNHPLYTIENRKRILEALAQIEPIAKKHKATVSQVIIHCTYNQPGITAAIVGARNPQQAIENARSLHLELSQDEIDEVVQLLEEGSHSLHT